MEWASIIIVAAKHEERSINENSDKITTTTRDYMAWILSNVPFTLRLLWVAQSVGRAVVVYFILSNLVQSLVQSHLLWSAFCKHTALNDNVQTKAIIQLALHIDR